MSAEECLCARCARVQLTCCQQREIYITPGDRQRIERHTGRADFFEFRGPIDPSYYEDDSDPAWRDHVFRSDGTRRILKRKGNGDCTFLSSTGCTLSPEIRPLVCRLFPLDYTERGIELQPVEGCPIQLLRPGQKLLETLNMHPEVMQRWHAQLYEEIRWEKMDQAEATGVA
jgi:Fe-S-cluster containining protein